MPDSLTPYTVDPAAVAFSCADDDNAARLHALLTALGYKPTRVDATPSARAQSLTRLLDRFDGITERERDLARLLVEGTSKVDELAAQLNVSSRTVTWLARTLCTRCHVADCHAFLAWVHSEIG